MSKIVLICKRDSGEKPVSDYFLSSLSERLCPDNIIAYPACIREDSGVYLCIYNPIPSLIIEGTSVCTGHMIESSDNWWKPSAPLPDGSYAMFRSDNSMIELATDITASRTIWYIQTDSLFIASTSLRAIVSVLRSFELNNSAMVWFIASGDLGLENSWDRRIKFLKPDSRLQLDRKTWKATIAEGEVRFHRTNQTDNHYKLELREALDYSVKGLSLDFSKWGLLLSGGIDSRSILMRLCDRAKLKCFIFEKPSSFSDSNSDSRIARRVAEYYGLEYQYFKLEPNYQELEQVLDRFVFTGECRTDNITHYLDGMNMWKILFESGVYGVLKGDEVFGDPLESLGKNRPWPRQAGHLLENYGNLHEFYGLLKNRFCEQQYPVYLNRRGGESLIMWRNRLTQEFQAPVDYPAWNEPRVSYVEMIYPLLSRKIVNIVRTMPDSCRVNKGLFVKIVKEDSPPIPFYRDKGRHEILGEYLFRRSEYTDILFDTLGSKYYRDIFSSAIIDHVLDGLRLELKGSNPEEVYLRQKVKQILPGYVLNLLRKSVFKLNLSYSALAFRIYLAGKAIQMFSADAQYTRP